MAASTERASAAGDAANAGPPNSNAGPNAIDEATTPLPIKTQIAFKPSYTFPNGDDRYKSELLFEPILPYEGVFVPGLEVPDFWSIARVQLSALSQQNKQGPASGLGDLTFADLAARHVGPFHVGAGFATVFPMATSPALGQGKLQFGPAVGVRLPGGPLNIAVLVQNFYSVAGSSQNPNLSYVTVQPFVTLHLPSDFFVSSDAPMSFYWRGTGSTVPVDLGLGRAFGEHFVGAAQFWYTLADSGHGDIKIRLILNFEP
jgi:hypothetical protein